MYVAMNQILSLDVYCFMYNSMTVSYQFSAFGW